MTKNDPPAVPNETLSSYSIQSVERACRVLKCFRDATTLNLNDVVLRTGLTRTTAFRLLATLAEQDMLQRMGKNLFAAAAGQGSGARLRIGYATHNEDVSFAQSVSEGIRKQAYAAGFQLVELSNRQGPTVANRNADFFVKERVDLVIEFQASPKPSSSVAAKVIESGIPMIAVENAHPGAEYFGSDNYRAGLLGGRALGQAAMQRWEGVVDELLLIDLPNSVQLPRSRFTGILAGLREVLPRLPDTRVKCINGNGRFDQSFQKTQKHLAGSKGKRILVAGLNDPGCLGALKAFEEAGRSSNCLAVGQTGSLESRREMRRPGSRLVGSVGYFPERYGEAVVALAREKLHSGAIPTATFVRHEMLTGANVDAFYPDDHMAGSDEQDASLRAWM